MVKIRLAKRFFLPWWVLGFVAGVGLGLVISRYLPVSTAGLAGVKIGAEEQQALRAFLRFRQLKTEFFPKGEPRYGKALGVSYDQPQRAVERLARLVEEVKLKDLNREQRRQHRQIATTPGTACEFCCGVKSFGNQEGELACGCAHNRALAGLTRFLLKNGYSTKEITTELEKWRRLFFPRQTLSAELERLKKKDPSIEEITKEFPDLLPQMVGGC